MARIPSRSGTYHNLRVSHRGVLNTHVRNYQIDCKTFRRCPIKLRNLHRIIVYDVEIYYHASFSAFV